MTLLRQTLWSAAAATILTGGRFLLTIVLARKLGVSEFGRFAFSQWVVDIIFLSLAFGLPGVATRFFAEYRTQPAKLLALERWYVRRAIVVAFGVAAASPFVVLLFNRDVDLGFALVQAGWSGSTAVLALLTARAIGLQQFRRIALSNGLLVSSALAGCLLLPSEGAPALLAMLVVTVATTASAMATYVRLPAPGNSQASSSPDMSQEMLRKFGINVWIGSLVSALVWSRGEVAVVRSEIGESGLAIYSVSLTLVGLATQGLMLLTGALGPHLAQMWGAGRSEDAIRQSREISDILALTGGAAAILLAAFGPELIGVSFGSAYVKAQTSLAILALGALALTSAALNQLLQLKTNGAFGRNANIAGAILLFSLVVPFIQIAGIEGAAASRTISLTLVALMTFYCSGKMISRSAFSFINQAKAYLLTAIIVLFSASAERGLHVRFVAFTFLVSVLLIWLRGQNGRTVFCNLSRRLYGRYFPDGRVAR